jgi:transcriptional regulator with XRE-family HTH domain
MNGYGERLALALKNSGFKQVDFANKLHITRTAISKILHGRQYLDFDLAVRACEILDISLDWLAFGKEADFKSPLHYNPERQRIEYLLSILKEAEYPPVIAAIEDIIEARVKDRNEQKTSRDPRL